jgi:hypothetical protein
MKQLFLNFLFFVASALVLVACAKIFPTQDRTNYPTSIQPAGNTLDKGNIKIDDKPVITGKTTFIKLYHKNNAPVNKLVIINGYSIYYNPYEYSKVIA